jgi:porin
MTSTKAVWATLGAVLAATPLTSLGQTPGKTPPAQSAGPTTSGAASGDVTSDVGFTTNLFAGSRSTLLGDAFGLRTALGNYGITFGLQTTNEVFGNVSGGIKRGASLNGLTMFSAGLDTDKAFGWEGGTFNVSGLWIYGPNFSQGYLGSLQTSSGIVASPTVRLWELWYQQAFLNGKMDIKIGQQSLDQEFMGSQGSSLFLNTMMGWPMLPSANLYAGGPAYPLSSLGVRLRGQPTGAITLLGGVFDDNPPGGPFDDDSQLRGAERAGALFNLNTGALFIAEVQYAINQPSEGDLDTPGTSRGLPGTYKLGMWYDTAKFPDQRFDNTGLSLADPNSSGIAKYHWHNYSIYAVADQTVWQGGGDDPRSISVFARPMGAPGNRNLIDFSVNAGVTFKAPIPGRDDDTFGLGFGVANVSKRAGDLDRDTANFAGGYVPIRGTETFLEATYQVQVAPWWQIQPDFQYVWNPGGGVLNPTNPTKRIGNEAIFGLRTNIVF